MGYAMIFKTEVAVSPLKEDTVQTMLHKLSLPKSAIPLVCKTITTRTMAEDEAATPTHRAIHELCEKHNAAIREKIRSIPKYSEVYETKFVGCKRIV